MFSLGFKLKGGVYTMPIKNSRLTICDPFLLNENTVNLAVADFLISKGFTSVEHLLGTAHGVDVIGKKNDTTIYVESKGSRPNIHDDDIVFDTGQIKTHAYMQVCKLMEYYNSGNQNKILVLANPDIPRIRTRVEKVRKSIEVLEFTQFWVQEDLTVKVEYPKASRKILKKLNLIDYRKDLTFN